MTRTIEAQGATVEEAIQQALAQLDVGQDEVDVEVLETKRGLFGAGKRAHVRVTVRDDREAEADAQGETEADDAGPTAGSQTTDSLRESTDAVQEDQVDTETVPTADRPAGEGQPDEGITPEERMRQLDEEADMAADFVEGMLDLLDLPGDIEIEVQEAQALLNIDDVGSGLLIGRRGATLDALQELVRCAVQRQTERRSHVRIDVEGYRSRQIEKLRDKCREAIAQVRESGESVRLEPMDAYERKMMHDLVARTGGVTSSSEGTEPKRRVVIHPEE